MFLVYDPQNHFRVNAKASTMTDALKEAREWAKATKREQWIDSPKNVLIAVIQPA